MVKVISVGNTCLDIILRYVNQIPNWGTEKFCEESETRFAGQATNFAIASARLANRTYLVSSVGNDLAGKNFKSELSQVPLLDCSFLE
jgi:sugar/nucleoside kinase (ribokinase family)